MFCKQYNTAFFSAVLVFSISGVYVTQAGETRAGKNLGIYRIFFRF